MTNPLEKIKRQRQLQLGGELITTAERKALFRVLDVARGMLAGSAGIVDGSALIASNRFERLSDDKLDDVLWPFRQISADSDDLTTLDPAYWAPSYLAELAAKRIVYEGQIRVSAQAACANLIATITKKLRECPVCGFPGDEAPYADDGSPSYATCRACGFSFDDRLDSEYDFSIWRQRWIMAGTPFARPPCPPEWKPPPSFSRGEEINS